MNLTELDSGAKTLPSTFIRTRGKKFKDRSDYDEFNALGNFSSKF